MTVVLVSAAESQLQLARRINVAPRKCELCPSTPVVLLFVHIRRVKLWICAACRRRYA